MKTITELRQEIVDRSLQAFHEGLFSGTSGNMSCYLREEDLMLITPTSVRYDVMRAEDVVALRLDGTVVEGHLKPSSEWRMHAAVYEGCPDVNAVFHTHSPYATAFAVNALLNPKINTVVYHVNVHMSADGEIERTRLFGFLKPTGDVTSYMTFVWTKTQSANGGVNFGCTITGINDAIQDEIRDQITTSFTPVQILTGK